MGYLVLARKWRPQTFEEVAGQDHVTKTLANAIMAGRVAHAYLFTGPRGVGKTTTARILARALNCEKGPTPKPCGTCEPCKSISAGSNMDVLEIDGASNRGIEDVRGLREQVRYAPSEGRYKVYIVDEVHMLTDPAFNALLKTLEEPPPHVVFIFATTSPQKIPVTILSRCQRFDFSRIPAATILERLARIVKEEKFEIDEAALALLARKARGSLRDAESLLDQVTSASEGALDENAVVDLLGVGGIDLFFDMCEHIGKCDASSALKDIDSAFRSGLDLGEFMSGLLEHLRSLFLLAVDPGLESALEVPSSDVARYKEQASRFKQAELLRLMEIVSQTAGVMKRSDDPRFHAELAVARMAEMGTEEGLGDIVKRLETLESRLADAGVSERPGSPGMERTAEAGGGGGTESGGKAEDAGKGRKRSPGRPRKKEAQEAVRTSPSPLEVELLTAEDLNERWKEVVTKVIEKKTYLGNFLAVASPVEAKSGTLELGFPEDCGFHRDQVSQNANRRIVQSAIQEVFGKFLLLKCTTCEGAVKKEGSGVPGEAGPWHPAALDYPMAPNVVPAPLEAPGGLLAAGHGTPPGSEGGARAVAAGSPGAEEWSAALGEGPGLGPDAGEGIVTERFQGDPDDPVQRVMEVFEGEIVEEPGSGGSAPAR